MAMAREKLVAPAPQKASQEAKYLNAQQVTSIAMGFLRSLGYKRGMKPKHVFIENQRYVVESEVGKKMLAKVQIDMVTSEIKEYAIEKKTEEAPISLPVEPKAMLIMFGVSVIVSLIFAVIDLPTVLSSLF
jgi:hypothetical protein